MRRIAIVLGCVLAASITGCSYTSYYDTGRDFRSEDATQIVKGKTTSAELVRLFGEPDSKTVKVGKEERWDYAHDVGRIEIRTFLIFSNTQRTGWLKQLSVEIKNGIVTNYTVTDAADGGRPAR
jgi:hypothetical protein